MKTAPGPQILCIAEQLLHISWHRMSDAMQITACDPQTSVLQLCAVGNAALPALSSLDGTLHQCFQQWEYLLPSQCPGPVRTQPTFLQRAELIVLQVA